MKFYLFSDPVVCTCKIVRVRKNNLYYSISKYMNSNIGIYFSFIILLQEGDKLFVYVQLV